MHKNKSNPELLTNMFMIDIIIIAISANISIFPNEDKSLFVVYPYIAYNANISAADKNTIPTLPNLYTKNIEERVRPLINE